MTQYQFNRRVTKAARFLLAGNRGTTFSAQDMQEAAQFGKLPPLNLEANDPVAHAIHMRALAIRDERRRLYPTEALLAIRKAVMEAAYRSVAVAC